MDDAGGVVLLARAPGRLPGRARPGPPADPAGRGPVRPGPGTVTSWLRAAGVTDEFRPAYALPWTVDARRGWRPWRLCGRCCHGWGAGQSRRLFAPDDTPTKRYGPCVQGAGVHHNPTPGPAGHKFVYGHVWVTPAWVARHPLWGSIALPPRAQPVRAAKGRAGVAAGVRLGLPHQAALAAELLRWLAAWLGRRGVRLWLAVDGAYARREVLREARRDQVTVVSRLPRTPPCATCRGRGRRRRGRPAIYGRRRIDLAKRAGQRRGWRTEAFDLYGRNETECYKTFLATWRPAGGVIRVAPVRRGKAWAAFFRTDPAASAADVLTAVADRAAIEQAFHDLKEVCGAGQRQLRNVHANVGAFHLNPWLHTPVELWAWGRPEGRPIDRRASPWDDRDRRPSHADRRRAVRRNPCARNRAAGGGGGQARKYRRLARRLLQMVH